MKHVGPLTALAFAILLPAQATSVAQQAASKQKPGAAERRADKRDATNGDDDKKPRGARFDPVIRNMDGWTVYIDPALLEGEYKEEGGRALRMLGDHLNRISILVPKDRLDKMQKIEIWIERHHPTLSAMQYHPGLDWLERFGYDKRLHKKVHIPRAAALLSRHQLTKHPWVVLHELAHAYHDQVLGFDDKRIIKAYEQAKASGKYEKVLAHTGKTVRHYGMTNEKEYFAEGTEAYFARNDFYPFVRAELKEFDPGFHAVLAEIWGPVR